MNGIDCMAILRFITLSFAVGPFLYVNPVLVPPHMKIRNCSIYVGTNNFILSYMNSVLVPSLLKMNVLAYMMEVIII